MEVDRPSFLQGLHRASQKADCRSSHSRNSRRVFRLPRLFNKDASASRFVNPKINSAQTNPRGKSKEGGRSPLLGRFKGFAKGQGSHAKPAKRFVWEKEEQRNGRRLSAASGGQDEGCGVCSDATPPLPFSFYRQRSFLPYLFCQDRKDMAAGGRLHLRCKLYSPLKRDSAACTPSSIRHSAASAACSSAVCSAG